MRNKFTRWMAVCGLLLSMAAALPTARAQTAGEMKPLATVVFGSYEELMQDVDFLGSLDPQAEQQADAPPASQQIEEMLMMFTQNKGLAGLDKTKPIGVIVQTDGQMPAGAICIPVTDVNTLLDLVKGFGVTVADAGNGVQQLSTQQGQTVFLKETNGWALISMAPQMLEAAPADPSTVLGPLAEDYDLAFRVHVQNVPETYRQQAADAMNQGAQQGMVQSEGESDADYAARQKQVQVQLDSIRQFISELDEFTFGLSVDNTQQRAYLDIAYTALPGTKLAEQIAANSNTTTNFAGFIQPDAAVTAVFSSKLDAASATQLEQVIQSVRLQAASAIEQDDEIESKDQAKAAVDDFLGALKATLDGGSVDGGAFLNLTEQSLTLVAGGRIADPAKVESGLKKWIEVAKEKDPEDAPEATWNVEQHNDVAFHKLAKPIEADKEELRRLFGEQLEIYVGIGKQAAYVALGRDALAAVKQAIDASAANPNQPTAPSEMSIALGQILNAAKGFADEEDRPQIEAVAKMLAETTSGRDHVRIVTQPIDNGIRMRIEAEEGVLRAIGMAGRQAQMQAAGF